MDNIPVRGKYRHDNQNIHSIPDFCCAITSSYRETHTKLVHDVQQVIA